MSEVPVAPESPAAPPPMIQMLYDDMFLMLLVGVVVPMLTYTVWGFIDLLSIPMNP